MRDKVRVGCSLSAPSCRHSLQRDEYCDMSEEQLIVSDPKVMLGKPVIAGTRITVESILEKLAAGRTQEELLEGYPQLTPESIRAALGFAAKALRADVIYPVAG